MKNLKLVRTDIPNTRAEFVAKWNKDAIFRAKAQLAGFNVLFDNVILPNGVVADKRVK